MYGREGRLGRERKREASAVSGCFSSCYTGVRGIKSYVFARTDGWLQGQASDLPLPRACRWGLFKRIQGSRLAERGEYHYGEELQVDEQELEYFC